VDSPDSRASRSAADVAKRPRPSEHLGIAAAARSDAAVRPHREDRDLADPPLDLTSRVPPKNAGASLADYLSERFRYHSRAIWCEEVREGRVFVDGRVGRADLILAAGAVVLYRKVHPEPPIDRNIRVVHEDDAVLIVDKPAHLPMHPDGPFVRHTLIHLLRSEHARPEAKIVHRLDRETSGLVVVARTTRARQSLERQFAASAVQKSYLAVVRGVVPGDFRCDAPIGHSTHSCITLRRSAEASAANPKSSGTAFEVVERGPERTLLRCAPSTGRTHQIRVHLEHCGFPLLGDKLYGRPDADYLDFVRRMKAGGDPRDTEPGEPPRQLLHAGALAFEHPTTGEMTAFESPMPNEFQQWLLAEA